MGDVGGASRLLIFSNLQESWSKASHVARDLTTVFSVSFVFSNNSWSIGQSAPPQQVSQHTTAFYVLFS